MEALHETSEPWGLHILPHNKSNKEETKRFGTPRSSEAKRPTINTRREGTDLIKNLTYKTYLSWVRQINKRPNFIKDN
tara:strand:+ start:405 stop:638 length:234 start_codon:yes stop_codon:yes gene_type:complete